ncbi:MAG: NAD-dependent protein deacylase [Defluviitaleaceae bacterium]|nr:NAD-dependent protein deacylase [Defluviitaleaceae bacterium]
MVTAAEMATLIQARQEIVFLTGAGVSTPSGIPDYRSVDGLYTNSGVKEPAYLLSRQALLDDTADFHRFIKQLFQKEATPNVIHDKIAALETLKKVTVITQNIDGLHGRAGSHHLVEFHGSLARCYCETCGENVEIDRFLHHYLHEDCGGLVRPDVVLYDEQIDSGNIERSLQAMASADTVVIVGTSFKVYPFASLIQYAKRDAQILTINKEVIETVDADATFLGDAVAVFELL